ncbi:unnamed protein product [Linum trigynum]|uniref:Uncharacterized protein n=1 Tax=Linum trigynum TaxID=586398 RepID=A0AAV2DCY3_9ROSI
MPAVSTPLAGEDQDATMQPETVAGQKSTPSASSSPNPKGNRETQQTKNRVKQMVTSSGVVGGEKEPSGEMGEDFHDHASLEEYQSFGLGLWNRGG